MLPKAVVFFDLDGTLYNSQHQLVASSLQAIKQLRQNNILPVIATGRARAEIDNTLAITGIDSFITTNGAAVTLHNQQIYHDYIAPQLCHQVVTLARQLGDTVSFYNDDHEAIDHATPLSLARHRYLGKVAQVDPLFYQKQPVQLLLIIAAQQEQHDQQYREQLGQNLKLYRTSDYTIDTINKNCSKKAGIQRLLTALAINKQVPTYAFGDSNNDLEMFSMVKHPIAMGNALPVVKQAAEYITTDHNSDGIINGLKHFKLI
ncbi:MAG: Cof-type HAD-IIB family hydrolase [Candidatus Paralactobacillus gallistercoris]|uniref:Cof-type HAD-IIB family hydrolase n=1 Tax=Candidatus Paralactobacillus gallistercoris TaxID=2838724 RepID=A0A948X116_9LACO|nr:Cof-type HAD-IIB family hydrolase [Candidatus Paralactobacillus gallistercoris]